MSGIDTFLGNIKVDATISMHSITILYMSYDCYRYAYQIKSFASNLTMISLLRFKGNLLYCNYFVGSFLYDAILTC